MKLHTPLNLLPFPKPIHKEQRETKTPAERRAKKIELFYKQGKRCAECDCWMTLTQGFMNSAELDHITPQPAGCSKDDSDKNLQVLCHRCNCCIKGSRRL